MLFDPSLQGMEKKEKVTSNCECHNSQNYWRKPEDGLRRKIDFIVAKSNFVLHHFFIDPKFFPLDGIIGLCPRRVWHGLFHTSVFSGMLLAS